MRILIVVVASLFCLVSCSFPLNIIRDEHLGGYTKSEDTGTLSNPQASEEKTVVTAAAGTEEAVLEPVVTVTDVVAEPAAPVEKTPEETPGDEAAPPSAEQRRAQEQESMDQALELLGQSQKLWEKGDFDNAINLLDQAYSLILDVDGEPTIAWQKDDLRFMIAKRVLEIYTSRSSVATGYQSEIPLTINDDVKKQIKRYQRGERRFFIESYRRSGMYRPLIQEELRKAGLPEELSWLPLVESGYKFKALSSARALGLWQIIPSTGYKFGLKRDHWIDERMDHEKSTKAAIAYLKELHGIFGDWLTVLAAYNCGEGRVLRVISRQHMNYLDNFWDLYRQLPVETAQYVPRFLAVLHIINDPAKYGFELDEKTESAVAYERVITCKCMHLRDVAKHLGVPADTLVALNSELRYKVTPNKEYALKVPAGTGVRLARVVEQIPKSKIPGSARYVRHKVKPGESLSTIARKYRSSVSVIVRANHLSSKHRIRAGKYLKIPQRGYRYVEEKKVRPSRKVARSSPGKVITYRVKEGNSLWLLARRFDTTITEIRKLNGLSSDKLRIGQTLRIRTGSGNNSYIVRKGDCIASIAEKHHIGLKDLLRLNGLTKKDNIYPGQVIIIAR